MIVRERPNAWQVLFARHGSILPRIAKPLAVAGLIAVVAVPLHKLHPQFLRGLAGMPFTLVGLSLSIFMSFRNTTSFNRWWEGRILWGQLIIACRAFARQVSMLPKEVTAPSLKALAGFGVGLAARLRDEDEIEALSRYVEPGDWEAAPSPTNAVLSVVGGRCAEMARAGLIDPIHYSVLETQLTVLTSVQAGCERIKTTPLPFAYSLLLHRTAYAFCLLLPFALAPILDYWTPVPTLLVGYAFFGLDALSDELANPFGRDQNSLPLNAMARIVERDMLFEAGVRDLPPPLLPTNNILM